jgi:hypothetical protein
LPLSHFSTGAQGAVFLLCGTVASFSHDLQPQIIIGHLFAHSGSMSGLSPPPRLLTRNAQHSRYLNHHLSYSLGIPSLTKWYCNTYSSGHIPLTLTLQPLARLGPAIRRDKDSTVPGPAELCVIFLGGVIFRHTTFAMCVGSLSMIQALTFHLGFSRADRCADTLSLGNVACLRVTSSPYVGWKLDETQSSILKHSLQAFF